MKINKDKVIMDHKEFIDLININDNYVKVLEYTIKDVKDFVDHELNCHILKMMKIHGI